MTEEDDVAEHYRKAMLMAETMLNSLPMPVSGSTSEVWKRISQVSDLLRKARHDVIHGSVLSSPAGSFRIEHDGFQGDMVGNYVTREGKRGVVLQQHGTRVVHVYGEKWLIPIQPPSTESPPIETRNEESGFVEIINEDVPSLLCRETRAPCEILLDLDTRRIIGIRVYDPQFSLRNESRQTGVDHE